MRVPYSPGEARVLGLLREDSARSTASLADLYYGGGSRPFNGQRVVAGLLASLSRKVVMNREPFRVRSSPRRGPHARFFWREPARGPRRSLAGQEDGTLLPPARGRKERTSGRLAGSP